EDGIRDRNVTGVQTCALPIFPFILPYLGAECNFFVTTSRRAPSIRAPSRGGTGSRLNAPVRTLAARKAPSHTVSRADARAYQSKIGRASCRERAARTDGGAVV